MGMKTKKEKPAKHVGDTLIGLGAMLCVLAFLVYVLTAVNGVANGLTIFGGCTLGLLMVMTGYLQRITAVLLTSKAAETPLHVAPRHER
jgi:hypothetical protein